MLRKWKGSGNSTSDSWIMVSSLFYRPVSGLLYMTYMWNLVLTVLSFFVSTLGRATLLNKAASPQNKINQRKIVQQLIKNGKTKETQDSKCVQPRAVKIHFTIREEALCARTIQHISSARALQQDNSKLSHQMSMLNTRIFSTILMCAGLVTALCSSGFTPWDQKSTSSWKRRTDLFMS